MSDTDKAQAAGSPAAEASGWRKYWTLLRRPNAHYSLLTLLAAGFFAGVIFWGGFNTVVEWTNREAFCISCHEMKNNVYEEYTKTVHYSNRAGVRAICADCHVPREWTDKMIRKVMAARELWGKVTGSVDTREKFEAKRLTLAEREWERMKANDSLECRNCHSLDSMQGEKQKQRARKQHEIGVADKKTCIDCHKGVAHQKPHGMKEDED